MQGPVGVRDQVRPLMEAGLRDREIAAQVGVSRERVRQLRVLLGIPKAPPAPPVRCVECGKKVTHVAVACAWCGASVIKERARLKQSKSGAHFCCLKHRAVWLQDQMRNGVHPPVVGKSPPVAGARTARFGISLTPAEYDQITAMAQIAGVSRAEYVRRCVLG